MVNSIIEADAVEAMKLLSADSIDCVLIDPPYNIGVDFGNSKYKQSIKEYVEWSVQWLREAERVVKDTGTIYIYGFSEILAHLSVEMNIPHRWLIWHYTNKTVPSSKFWQRSHESIICAWKQKDKRTYNRDKVREPYTENYIKGYKDKNRTRTSSKGRFSNSNKKTSYQVNEKGALPRDVLKISSLAGGAGSKERIGWCLDCNTSFFGKEIKKHKDHNHFKHPTQKPMELTKKLLLACCPDEATVLIPFAGSGSECLVANQLGYSFIAYDLNPEFVKMGNDIIRNHAPVAQSDRATDF